MISWLSNKYYRPVGFRLAEVLLFGILPQVILPKDYIIRRIDKCLIIELCYFILENLI